MLRKQTLVVAIIMVLYLMVVAFVYNNEKFNNANDGTNDTTTQTQTINSTTAPVTEPTQPQPKELGAMTMGDLFYKPKQASSVMFVDTIALNNEEIAALRCLQGLVARTDDAAIYLLNNYTDRFWYDIIRDDYGIVFVKSTLSDVFEKYHDLIKTLIIYDSEKSKFQYSVAQTYASINDGIAVDKSTYEKVKVYFKEVEIIDISDKIASPVDAINHIANELYDKCEHHYIGIVDITSEINDYVYATNTIAVTVDNENEEQMNAFKKLLSKKFNSPAIVFSDNSQFSTIVSSYGFGLLSSNGFSNCTYFSSFPTRTKGFSQPKSTDKLAVKGKTYISICINNDDKISTISNMKNLMGNVVRGSTPINIEINAALYELAPTVLSWYYNNRNSYTCFISSGSGLIDINTDNFSQVEIDKLFSIENHLLESSGISIMSTRCNKFSDIVSKLNIEAIITPKIEKSEIMSDVAVIKYVEIDDLLEFKAFELEQDESKAEFLCFNINTSHLNENAIEQLNTLIYNFEQANMGNVEFLLLNDLALTFKQYVENELNDNFDLDYYTGTTENE